MKYFGTGGIRGIWGSTLDVELVTRVAMAIVEFKPKSICLGHDTRESGDEIQLALYKVFASRGITVVNIGVVPTTVLAFMTHQFKCDIGIMITASHNPPDNNGIKVFDKHGEQFDGADLEKLDTLVGEVVYKVEGEKGERYMTKQQPRLTMGQTDPTVPWKNYILDKFRGVLGGRALPRVAIDFANGSGAAVGMDILQKLGFTVVDGFNMETDGKNVNRNCGATHPEFICDKVKKSKGKYEIGFAFDGDADRCIVCDERGNLIEPDVLLAALALNNFDTRHVVGTVMTNTGIEKFLKTLGLTLHRTPVGERYVVAKIKELEKTGIKNIVGGEASSHYVFPDIIYAGESLVALLKTVEMITARNKPVSEAMKDVAAGMWPSILKNVPELIPARETKYDDARVLIRQSGTEKLTRVFVEAETKQRMDELLKEVLG